MCYYFLHIVDVEIYVTDLSPLLFKQFQSTFLTLAHLFSQLVRIFIYILESLVANSVLSRDWVVVLQLHR